MLVSVLDVRTHSSYRPHSKDARMFVYTNDAAFSFFFLSAELPLTSRNVAPCLYTFRYTFAMLQRRRDGFSVDFRTAYRVCQCRTQHVEGGVCHALTPVLLWHSYLIANRSIRNVETSGRLIVLWHSIGVRAFDTVGESR